MTRTFDELARAVIAEVAPEEAAFYAVISAAVRRDPGRVFPARDDLPGPGPAGAAALVTPIVITVLGGVVSGHLTGVAGQHTRRLSGRLGNRSGHRPEDGIATPAIEVPVLDHATAEEAGRAVERMALDMGIEPGAALRLRQAMHGHLSGQR
ncbi:hypothetical protein GCM10010517_35180 [Streptosporangium fragile]|uniref:Uncharacterized protein n=1 Tax=Streptosporangium fragile TaxID=46186 RepID=A0ABP6IE21_9ACTN